MNKIMPPRRGKRMLIFVGTRAALEAYDMAGYPILNWQLMRAHGGELLKAFRESSDGVLVVTNMQTSYGFSVPHDTFIVFDESWRWADDHPYTIQAKGRRRFPPAPTNPFIGDVWWKPKDPI